MDEGIRSASYGVLSDAQVEAIRLEAGDGFPNLQLPVLLYRGAFGMPHGLRSDASRNTRSAEDGVRVRVTESETIERAARMIEKTFALHRWSGGWRDGIYDYHHYHSTAHEVLGCFGGRATVQLGGPDGPHVAIAAGDVLVLPAGAAHKRLSASADFRVVGAYERGRSYDMQLGDPSSKRSSERRMREVPPPEFDPMYGDGGPLLLAWRPSMVPPPHELLIEH
jgi:uncharacterized protein YjlB